MMLVLVFNSRKRYRVNLVFPFHDVFLYFIFFIVNKLCLCLCLYYGLWDSITESFTGRNEPSKLTYLLPTEWLRSSVGSALHQHRSGHGFESC